jgi:hypothetical protein
MFLITKLVKLWSTSAKLVLMATLSGILYVTEYMNQMMNFKVLRLFEFFSIARNYKGMRRQEFNSASKDIFIQNY